MKVKVFFRTITRRVPVQSNKNMFQLPETFKLIIKCHKQRTS